MTTTSSPLPSAATPSGLVGGASNSGESLFSGFLNSIQELGNAGLNLYSGWSQIQAKKDEIQANQQAQQLQANMQTQQIGAEIEQSQNLTKIASYAVVGIIFVAGSYVMLKVLRGK